MEVQDDLIFDLGACEGQDTEFYLAKGFRVVAVEANPVLHARLAERFAAALGAGALVLHQVAVWSEIGTLPLYLNEQNDHWSSLRADFGTRGNSRFRVVQVPTITLPLLLQRHGVPHYLKLDIEGADHVAVRQLQGLPLLPRYVSVEEYGPWTIDHLDQAGYRRFKTVPQNDKSWAVPPRPAREGRYVPRRFDGRDSGLFGAELPGAWLDYDSAIAAHIAGVRTRDNVQTGPAGEWWDVHATL